MIARTPAQIADSVLHQAEAVRDEIIGKRIYSKPYLPFAAKRLIEAAITSVNESPAFVKNMYLEASAMCLLLAAEIEAKTPLDMEEELS